MRVSGCVCVCVGKMISKKYAKRVCMCMCVCLHACMHACVWVHACVLRVSYCKYICSLLLSSYGSHTAELSTKVPGSIATCIASWFV